ncbi:glycosyl transferase family 11 [Dyadobacter jejuensis]|uniref:Glycosyl transferase family 11 n=1 Tax=Dyadobacter jejuensis TaxID=1082580 RepID=A0A316AMM0_9BACT|nr:alpha-1,2-fucosyltransferase [Dyadobacter jejuensis]PWJ58782.1 glycosyl transferase family 11 [Dyadobacter jejuensis]
MVGVKFNGRLGNQLFQYTFFLYLKSRDSKKYYFFPNPHHASLAKYFDLGFWPNFYLNNKLCSLLFRMLPKLWKFEDVFVHNFFSPKPHTPVNFTMYQGYFQSDYYLKQLPKPANFRLKERYREEFRRQFGDLFDHHKTVVVHIRRTDYLSYGKRDISLPIEYFQRQLEAIENIDSYKVLFVSDDMPFVRQSFPEKPNYIFSSNSEIIDFQLIQNADVAIISNSTFAWWAAYLCPKTNRVIAPENWFGFRIGREHPKGIMTDRFEWKAVLPAIS